MKTTLVLTCLAMTILTLGCSGGGDSNSLPPIDTATLTGRVVDDQSQPLAGATIVIDNETVQLTSDENGYFRYEGLEPGNHKVTAIFNGEVLCESCFPCAEGVEYDLGDLGPGRESTCETPPPTIGDQDSDGLSDNLEQSGWTVTVILGDRTTESRHVVSDPLNPDSDGDGLTDDQEYAARLDPQTKDTDGDLLSDYGEFYIYKSHPLMVDTDGDSCLDEASECISDPNFWDGYELTLLRTSPTLKDTDGDGFSDSHEVNGGGTNPRLADLPELSLVLHGNPLLELDATINTGDYAKSQTLDKETENQIDTDNTSTKMALENTVSLHTEVEVGTGTWPPSANAKLTTDTKFSHALTHDTSSSWKKDSVSESQKTFESWEENTVHYDNGKLSAAMKIVNLSDLSFKVKDLRVIAYRLEGGGNFTLIGTMQPGETEWPEGGQILGPGGEFTMTLAREDIGAFLMRDLVRNPTAMMFEVGSYSLFQLDAWGVNETVNYAVLGETVVQRTGLLVIDYGDGNVKRHMVATNVYRNPDGSGLGITLKEVLGEVLQLDYETAQAVNENGEPGKWVLFRVGNAESYDVCSTDSAAYNPAEDCVNTHKRGFWMVGGTGRDFDLGKTVDFDDIRLNSGEQVNLVYVKDSDGDGIFDREEYLLGTDKMAVDTDNDGLTDFEESKVGWQVAVVGQTPYAVFPNPRFADLDTDYLSDKTEKYTGTDPFMKDTDGDGDGDAIDYDPLSPPCLQGELLGMTAWWDGSDELAAPTYWAKDYWLSIKNDGEINGDDSTNPLDNIVMVQNWKQGVLGVDVPDDKVFRLNPLPDQNDQYIEVPDHDDLDAQREYSVSAWVFWTGVATNSDWSTVLTKGPSTAPNYALYINPEGIVKMALQRTAKVKCVQCSIFGCNDSLCADSTASQLMESISDTPIPPQEWVHLTGIFSGETMRIYANDSLIGDDSTTYKTQSGLNHRTYTTKTLTINDDPLLIGISPDQNWPYRGLMDDIQIFGRGLSTDQVQQIQSIGVCEPPVTP